jgi:hypothetical protein
VISYPYRTEAQEAAVNRLPATAYAEIDRPFLFTQRYSLSPDFEPSDVVAKQQVDLHGSMDMLWSLEHWKEQQ